MYFSKLVDCISMDRLIFFLRLDHHDGSLKTSIIPHVFEDNGYDQFEFLSSVSWISGSSATSGSHLSYTTPIIAGIITIRGCSYIT